MRQGITQNLVKYHKMKKTNIALIVSATIAVAAVGYWFYEKQRKKAIDARVDSLEAALQRLEAAKNEK